MKVFFESLKVTVTSLAVIIALFISTAATAQTCPTGYTSAAVNWDWQYKINAFSSPARFGFGVNGVSMTWGTGVASPANPANSTFTGYGSGYGSGALVQFNITAGTITYTFDSEIQNARFAVYDLDLGQGVTVSAVNAANTALPVTMSKSNATSNVVLSNNASPFTAPKGTGPTTDIALTATTSGVNVDIAGPVKTITLTFTKTTAATTADAIFISDITGCVNGTFPSGFNSSIAPEAGQSVSIIASDAGAATGSSVYTVNTTTAVATKLFTDASLATINSLAYDPYNAVFYYCNGLVSSTNKSIYKYDLKTCTKSTFIADVTVSPYNIALNSSGLGGGGASFNNNSLYIGVDVASSQTEDQAIWRLDLNSAGAVTATSRVFGVNGSNGSISNYNWGDFVVYNGILYNFNASVNAPATTNETHYNLNTQTKDAGFSTALPSQSALNYDGTIYNITTAIATYNKTTGAFGTGTTITGGGWLGASSDAAEYFKFPSDYGDAPTTYGRPYHQMIPCAGNTVNLRLGAAVDYEVVPTFATAGATSTGDDDANTGAANDEDGVASFPTLHMTPAGTTAAYTVSVAVANTSGASRTLHAWIDFNRDGNFSASEYGSATVAVNATTASVTFPAQANGAVVSGLTYARFRITTTALADVASTTTVDERATAAAADGEVEDYSLTIVPLQSISGTVYNDINGLTGGINGTAIGNPSATQLYAYLNNGGFITEKATVSTTNGTYTFSTASQNTTYTVVVSTANLTVGAATPTASVLPTNWVNTGEGTAANGDGVVNGITAVLITTANVSGVNFGIEQLPTAVSPTALATQVNPGSTNAVSIPTSNFTGTDPDGGSIASIKFTTFPTNVTSITIAGTNYTAFPNGGVTASINSTVSIDPMDGAITANIPFKVIDNAGFESSNEASVSVPFNLLTVSGTVYNDINGLTGGINGTVIGNPSATQLYAYLSNGSVIADKATVSVTNGTYSFASVAANSNYTVMLSTENLTIGAATPTTTVLPTGWVNVGEGTATNIDATANGIFALSTTAANVSGVNFGIERTPTAVSPAALATQVNPSGTAAVSIPTANFTGTDFDGGSIISIKFTTFPTNVTSITIAGTNYTAFPIGGVTAPINSTVSIDPADGAITANVPFKVIDNAGFESSNEASVSVPFNLLTVSGTVYNDINGLTGGINGTAIGNPSATQLYAYLNTNGVITEKATVSTTNGTYSFTSVKANSAYSVIVTTANLAVNAATPTSTTLPTGWVNVGEGTTGNLDATANGIFALNTTTANISGLNFGIERTPTAVSPATLATQVNPSGNTAVSIATTNFTGTDFDGGSITSIRFTTFPTNVTSITIAGTNYTSFPNGGVTAPINSTVSIDPMDGAVTANIPFKVIDNAGFESSNEASVSVPFNLLTISGTVYNDINGLTGGINGTAIGNPSATQLYAYLNNGSVIADKATVSVTNGTYSFTSVAANSSYTVMISTENVTMGAATPANTVLPTGWVNVGEGTATNIDATANGIFALSTTSANVSGVNFGIERTPTAVSPATLTTQVNPGGTTAVSIATANFSGTDFDGGSITSIRFTTFSTNVTSITIAGINYTSFPNGGVTAPINSTVSIDPVDGAVTASIPFKVIDNAGFESSNEASVSVPFNLLTVSGTVYNDANGLKDNTVNGTLLSDASGNPLFAYLALNGEIMEKAAVTNGAFAFSNAYPNKAYVVAISTVNAPVGAAVPALASLPANWALTGESFNGANDATSDFQLAITTLSANVTGVNFGADRLPVSSTADFNITAPANNATMVLTVANTVAPLAGIDAEDGTLGAGNTIRITNLVDIFGNELYYNNVLVTMNQVITSYDPDKLSVKFTSVASGYAAFEFAFEDAAGQRSNFSARYSLSWVNQTGGSTPLPVTLVSFTAKNQEQGVVLNWKTASEKDNNYFEVERSANGKTFEKIGTVKGNGTTSAANNYILTDKNPLNGTAYYRLKQVDFSGLFEYSPVVSVTSKAAEATATVFPNPFNTQVAVNVTVKQAQAIAVSVYATNGTLVKTISLKAETGNNVLAMPLETLPAGVYVMHLKGQNFLQVTRISKVN